MANEFYTLIVVPHAKARFRKFQVSVRLTRWVLAACGGLALFLLGILAHYSWIAVEVGELRRLKVENLALATKAKAYEENAGHLQARVLQLQSIVTKLGMMAGLDQSLPDPTVGGVGGLPRIETTAPSVDVASSLSQPGPEGRPASPRSPRSSRRSSRTRGSCSPRRPPSGRSAATFRRLWQPPRSLHGAAGLPLRASTSRRRAARQVTAPADGVVILGGQKSGYGNALVVDHGYGVVTRYGHLDRLQRPPRPARPPRRGDRLRRQHRSLHRAAPALRGLGERPGPQPDPVHHRRVQVLRLVCRPARRPACWPRRTLLVGLSPAHCAPRPSASAARPLDPPQQLVATPARGWQ